MENELVFSWGLYNYVINKRKKGREKRKKEYRAEGIRFFFVKGIVVFKNSWVILILYL